VTPQELADPENAVPFYRNLPAGKFKAITIDPPWRYATSRAKGNNYAPYDTLTIRQIAKLPVREWADTSCQLWMWTVRMFDQEALDMCNYWGFEPKQEIIWVKAGEKIQVGMGWPLRNCHERCIVACRGDIIQQVKNVNSVFVAPRGDHSAKPDKFYDIVEKINPGPYLDLFARTKRQGWTCWGDQIK
jgi:N6-adenosine-specific RNA methylase IME4